MDGYVSFSTVLATFFSPLFFQLYLPNVSQPALPLSFKDCLCPPLFTFLYEIQRGRGWGLGALGVAMWGFHDGHFDLLLPRSSFFILNLHLASTEEWNSDEIFFNRSAEHSY